GWPMLLLAAIGSVVAVARRDWAVLVVASLPVALYVVMGSSKMYVARFMLPGVPALAVLAAVAIRALALAARARALSDASTPWSAQLIGIAAARPSFDVAAFVTAALTAAALVGTLPASLQFDALLTRPDTRTQALDWLAANLPANATVLTDPSPFGPSLDKLPVHVVLPPPGQAVYDQSVESYRAQGIQYIVSSSFISDAPALDAARNARRLEFYGRLDASAQTLAEFDPARSASLPFVYDRIYGPLDSLDHIEYPGPRLKIYRL
ncbi:MAG: hypothetical protein JOZ81_03445, partial [Chloroflexi bacterium]|nr:hypothetical protein [Chloroflexota bacterium]